MADQPPPPDEVNVTNSNTPPSSYPPSWSADSDDVERHPESDFANGPPPQPTAMPFDEQSDMSASDPNLGPEAAPVGGGGGGGGWIHSDDEDDKVEAGGPPEERRKARGSVHFGDEDFEENQNDEDDYGDATWTEVREACCVHTRQEWLSIGMGLFFLLVFLYFFLFALQLLSDGARVMSGCRAGALFGDDTNPITGLMIGILATVLLQSSSTTSSIIVSLVGDDVTGTGTISVSQGIYMIMGANIGTSVTSTIVAVGHMGDGDQLERAFAGATVHDMFNFLSVAVLLPVEVATGYLEELTGWIVSGLSFNEDDDWEGPVRRIVSPLAQRVILANTKVTKQIASGDASCDDFYPMSCQGTPSYKNCNGEFGLIACDEDLDVCPAFFVEDATATDDKVSGGVVFFLAIFILFTCLLGLVATLQKMLVGMSTRIVYRATDVNGYVAMCLGAGFTMLVQSSSITTSTLIPLVGMGAIRLEQMYPLTLGANIGTTMTGILAALVSDTIESLQVALAHLFFNITGILLFYPIPFMRAIPLHLARQLGKATRLWRGFPVLYICFMFVLVPLIFLGISALFERGTKGFTVLGVFLVALLAVTCLWIFYWCRCQDGKETCADCMKHRERRRVASRDLPDNMEYALEKIHLLMEHTGLQDDDEEEATTEAMVREVPADEDDD